MSILLSEILAKHEYKLDHIMVTMHLHDLPQIGRSRVPCDFALIDATDLRDGSKAHVTLCPNYLNAELEKWYEYKIPSVNFTDLRLIERECNGGVIYLWDEAYSDDVTFRLFGEEFPVDAIFKEGDNYRLSFYLMGHASFDKNEYELVEKMRGFQKF